jgi:hypothetical protein
MAGLQNPSPNQVATSSFSLFHFSTKVLVDSFESAAMVE